MRDPSDISDDYPIPKIIVKLNDPWIYDNFVERLYMR